MYPSWRIAGDTIANRVRNESPRPLVTIGPPPSGLGSATRPSSAGCWTAASVQTRTEGGHHRVSEAEIDRLVARQRPAGRPAPRSGQDDPIVELSARNRLYGFIEEIRVDGLLAQVRLRVGSQMLTAVITADAVRALKLRRGDDAMAIVKSTEVMIARMSERGERKGKRKRD